MTAFRQPRIWSDIHQDQSGEMIVGIECDDELLTFDGHFICLIPKRADEEDLSGAIARAEAIMDFMRGKRQAKREG